MRQDRQASVPRQGGDVVHSGRTMVDMAGEKLTREYSHHRHGIVVKDCGDIFRRELVGRVGNEQAGLANCTVTDDNTPVCLVSICVMDQRCLGAKIGRIVTYLIVATTIPILFFGSASMLRCRGGEGLVGLSTRTVRFLERDAKEINCDGMVTTYRDQTLEVKEEVARRTIYSGITSEVTRLKSVGGHDFTLLDSLPWSEL